MQGMPTLGTVVLVLGRCLMFWRPLQEGLHMRLQMGLHLLGWLSRKLLSSDATAGIHAKYRKFLIMAMEIKLLNNKPVCGSFRFGVSGEGEMGEEFMEGL